MFEKGDNMKVAEKVYEAIKPLFEESELRLVEVEYVKRVDGMHLVVLLDKDTGVTLDDCSMVAKMVDPILEEINPTNDAPYYFDVSSYGLDRPLKYDWQLDKYMNQKLVVKLYMKVQDFKDFTAELVAYDENTISFKINNEEKTFERKQIATILPYIEF